MSKCWNVSIIGFIPSPLNLDYYHTVYRLRTIDGSLCVSMLITYTAIICFVYRITRVSIQLSLHSKMMATGV